MCNLNHTCSLSHFNYSLFPKSSAWQYTSTVRNLDSSLILVNPTRKKTVTCHVRSRLNKAVHNGTLLISKVFLLNRRMAVVKTIVMASPWSSIPCGFYHSYVAT